MEVVFNELIPPIGLILIAFRRLQDNHLSPGVNFFSIKKQKDALLNSMPSKGKKNYDTKSGTTGHPLRGTGVQDSTLPNMRRTDVLKAASGGEQAGAKRLDEGTKARGTRQLHPARVFRILTAQTPLAGIGAGVRKKIFRQAPDPTSRLTHPFSARREKGSAHAA